jgi:hypothetical protein
MQISFGEYCFRMISGNHRIVSNCFEETLTIAAYSERIDRKRYPGFAAFAKKHFVTKYIDREIRAKHFRGTLSEMVEYAGIDWNTAING